MPGRKLLYILRTPADVAHEDLLFPRSTSSSQQDDISVVFLNAPGAWTAADPGRTYVLEDGSGTTTLPSGVSILSYADLLNLMFETDSTIVL